jgi:hypothetical protein
MCLLCSLWRFLGSDRPAEFRSSNAGTFGASFIWCIQCIALLRRDVHNSRSVSTLRERNAVVAMAPHSSIIRLTGSFACRGPPRCFRDQPGPFRTTAPDMDVYHNFL